uniref:Uncharacterized protein n=1 Tax=Trichogramma kaykai TaxID=54128 RepID=A0ABD2XQI1_9HYME
MYARMATYSDESASSSFSPPIRAPVRVSRVHRYVRGKERKILTDCPHANANKPRFTHGLMYKYILIILAQCFSTQFVEKVLRSVFRKYLLKFSYLSGKQ